MKSIYLFFLLFSLALSAQENVEVYFDFDKFDLNETAIQKLTTAIANYDTPQVIKIYGFCDWKGSNAYNDTLSLRRVNAVRDFLTGKGIAIQKDYEAKGFGEDFKQSEVQAENRKVRIVFEETKKPVKATEPTEQTLAEKVKSSKKGDKIKLQNINFHNNSAVVVDRSKPTLIELLCILEENPNLKIQIQGHICCQLVTDVNDISTARARAIYNYLIRNKINKNRLSFKGFGTSMPIYKIPEKSAAEEDANRRVEIMIVEH